MVQKRKFSNAMSVPNSGNMLDRKVVRRKKKPKKNSHNPFGASPFGAPINQHQPSTFFPLHNPLGESQFGAPINQHPPTTPLLYNNPFGAPAVDVDHGSVGKRGRDDQAPIQRKSRKVVGEEEGADKMEEEGEEEEEDEEEDGEGDNMDVIPDDSGPAAEKILTDFTKCMITFKKRPQQTQEQMDIVLPEDDDDDLGGGGGRRLRKKKRTKKKKSKRKKRKTKKRKTKKRKTKRKRKRKRKKTRKRK